MKHSILITGSSTGIGRAVAVHLAEAGHQVFAGVRTEKDVVKLKAESHDSLQPVIIDVTDSKSIKACVAEVEKLRDRTRPFSLMNNAGIAVAGPVEALKLSEYRKQFEVNFFGLIETTQAFLPLIRESQGRIINVSSIGGRVSAPFLGAYSASKFAVEALSDSLRQELEPFGVQVIVLEPGPIQTEIWNKGLSRKTNVEEFCDTDRLPIYFKRFEKFERLVYATARRSIPAKEVSMKVLNALEAKRAPIRIVVASMQSRIQLHAGEWLPARTLDKFVRKLL